MTLKPPSSPSAEPAVDRCVIGATLFALHVNWHSKGLREVYPELLRRAQAAIDWFSRGH
jgi:hypothetical protein